MDQGCEMCSYTYKGAVCELLKLDLTLTNKDLRTT